MSSNTGSSRSRSASFAVLLFILAAIDLNADQRVLISLSAFTENEINNEAYASRNLFLVPGLSFAVRGLEFPMYGRLQFENRMNTGSMATNSYLDTELRYRVHFGGTLELIPGFTYNPEYEARIKSYVGYSFEDYFTWENRFHQNFFLPFSSSLGLTFKAMPTWMIANTGSDSRGGGDSIYNDFYFEGSLGPVWDITEENRLSMLLYNEMRVYESFETSPGTLNNERPYLMLEFQFRIIWSYVFRNGITISPFARVGIMRNVYSRIDGDVTIADQRRDRFGFTLRANSAASGTSLYLESYYQRQEQDGDTPLHRFMFKVGFDYNIRK